MVLLRCNADYWKVCDNKKVDSVTRSVTRTVGALQCHARRCDCRRAGTTKQALHCPAYDDEHLNWAVIGQDGRASLACGAGRSAMPWQMSCESAACEVRRVPTAFLPVMPVAALQSPPWELGYRHPVGRDRLPPTSAGRLNAPRGVAGAGNARRTG